MYSQARIRKMIDNVSDLSITSGLNDTQVIWVKNKITQLENQFVTVNSRLTALETKANLAITKFTQIDNKIKAIEARLTAGGL